MCWLIAHYKTQHICRHKRRHQQQSRHLPRHSLRKIVLHFHHTHNIDTRCLCCRLAVSRHHTVDRVQRRDFHKSHMDIYLHLSNFISKLCLTDYGRTVIGIIYVAKICEIDLGLTPIESIIVRVHVALFTLA